jgi:hypothetical protein
MSKVHLPGAHLRAQVTEGIRTLARENVSPSAYRQHCKRSVPISDTLGAVPETGHAYRS